LAAASWRLFVWLEIPNGIAHHSLKSPACSCVSITDQGFVNKVRADLASAERNRNALTLTRLVLEIIAEKAG
jgi:hypothetical protein